MSRVDTNQSSVITSVVAQLRSALSLTERQCYETDAIDPSPAIPPGGDYFVTVSGGPGAFDVPAQIGGGANQLTEQFQAIVTAYSSVKLDSRDSSEQQLHEANRGLYALKAKLLKAMVGADLTDSDGNTFLRQLVYALRASRPMIDREQNIGRISVEFGIEYDWDLS